MKTRIIMILLLTTLPAAAETFNIEIDYMVDTSVGSPHSHMPTQAEIDAVVQMFACQGHTLNVVVDDQIPHYYLMRRDPADNSFFDYSGTTDSFGSIKSTYFDNTGGGWHYAVFGHRYEKVDTNGVLVPSGSSGLGQRPGGNFIVTLGAWSDSTGAGFTRASTLAHEFGHNLGLSHCGGNNCDPTGDNSPVLTSIMSYNYQLEGVRSGLLCNGLIPESAADLFKDIDYSGGRMATLQEAALDEALGTTFRSVDWNCSGTVAGVVSQDLSSGGPTWCGNTGSLDLIGDYDEWSLIVDTTKLKTELDTNDIEEVSCITVDEVRRLGEKANCPTPTLAFESCVTAEVYFVDGSGTANATGTWKDPVNTVNNAQNLAPSGSALVLFPGTLNEGGSGGVILDQPVRLYSATSTVIK
jgi:hypothetical protein